eukprot:CCRYP_016600-RA/>CCRYP_016600-RA protein AED:0.02 eAED:0.02 QI:214/1/1/1/1/1/2/151/650
MSLKPQISAAFRSSAPSLPPPLLTKLTHLCSTHGLTPSELYVEWEAHSLTRQVDTLDDLTFPAFEASVKTQHKKAGTVVITTTALGKRSSSAGVTPSPAPKKHEPDRSGLSAIDSLDSVARSPASKAASPAVTVTPQKSAGYAERTGRGDVVACYNPRGLDEARGEGRRRCQISMHGRAKHQTLQGHMFAPLNSRATSLEERLLRMNDAICQEYELKSEEEEMLECEFQSAEQSTRSYWTPVGVPGQSSVVCVGRVCNEAHEGRLNSTSLLLEGSRRHSNGARISVDLPKDLSYSLFPGQIVAMEGMNASGRCIRPIKVMEGAAPPKETVAAHEVMQYYQQTNGQPLKIVTMCGPYTTSDSLEYSPLVDAVLQISEEKPDVVILCGPFVDCRQPLVRDGPVIEEDGVMKIVTFEYLFRVRISELLMEMYENYPDLETQIVLVPSVEDAVCDSVYPQPPLVDVEINTGMVEFGNLGLRELEYAGREEAKNPPKRVHCVSNPCTLKINEIVIGVTSTDILFHINCDSANANLPPTGRLTRIAQHLIQQRSYYPLFPAAKGACLDLTSAEKWEMPVQPDILIVPSKLNPFVKEVMEGTVVVNPGALTKNSTGGTYAVMDVHPIKKERLEEGMAEGVELENQVQERLRVDIKRI